MTDDSTTIPFEVNIAISHFLAEARCSGVAEVRPQSESQLLEKSMTVPRIVLIASMFLSSTPRDLLFADEEPSSAVTPPTNYSAPANPAWDLSTITIYESTDVDIRFDVADNGTPIISAVVDSAAEFGTFAFSVVSDDGFESMHCTGIVEHDGSIMYQARHADLLTASSSNAGAAAWAEADSEPGFWEGYWYYLTNPASMDDDLEYTFYGAVGTAGVAATAAGGLVLCHS